MEKSSAYTKKYRFNIEEAKKAKIFCVRVPLKGLSSEI
jgi:hypothetical protein